MEDLARPCLILTTCAVWLWDPYLWTARPAVWPGGCPACSARSTAGGTTNTGGCKTVGRRRARRWTGHVRTVWQTHLALDSCGKFLYSFLEVFFKIKGICYSANEMVWNEQAMIPRDTVNNTDCDPWRVFFFFLEQLRGRSSFQINQYLD